MSDEYYVIIGRQVDEDELRRVPNNLKFSRSKPLDLPGLAEVEEKFASALALLLKKQRVRLRCPVGPHDDPGLDVRVVRACSIRQTDGVFIQCTRGHWAEYPCL